MPTADIYSRVSTKIQAEEGTSLISQTKACQLLAQEKGFSIGEVFTEDWPGDTLERPLLEKLRQRVRERKVQGVFIYDPDRLVNLKDLFAYRF